MTRKNYLLVLTALFAVLWLALAIDPVDRPTWVLENVLLVTGVVILWTTRRVLPLSTPSYTLLFVFLCLHAVGTHYSYSMVPYDEAFRSVSGHSLNQLFGFTRNHYDRLVHLAYGLLLVLPVREMLMLHARVRGFWSYFLPLDLVMSSSLVYELIEWLAAVVYGGDLGAAFLGTQGDEWDAQRDMALAGLGALLAILAVLALNLWRRHDMTLGWLVKAGKLSPDELPR
jgi:putative membrane protein